MICEHGVQWCTACGATVHDQLTYCPGYRLNGSALQACRTGQVVDLPAWVRLRRRRAR